jgi:hypothetical protein
MSLLVIESEFENDFISLSELGKQKVIKYLHKELEREKNKATNNKNDKNIEIICIASRANGSQCTRKKKNGADFCGTHLKSSKKTISPTTSAAHNMTAIRREVWTHDFNGIIYYIDADFNVYKHDDIMNNTPNPKIIHKYKIADDGTYSIIKQT